MCVAKHKLGILIHRLHWLHNNASFRRLPRQSQRFIRQQCDTLLNTPENQQPHLESTTNSTTVETKKTSYSPEYVVRTTNVSKKTATNKEAISPAHDHQLDFFARVWATSPVDVLEQGGCIEVRPTVPPAEWLNRPVSTLPLVKSTTEGLIKWFNISYLTPFQMSTMCSYLGRRDLFLLGRPGTGKSFGSLISIIELVTRRVLEICGPQRLHSNLLLSAAKKSSSRDIVISGISSTKKQSTVDALYGKNAGDLINSKLVAIVVCPTWEAVHLMTQQCSKLLQEHPLKLRCGWVSGGSDASWEIKKLRETDRPHILFGTPGRLAHHITHTHNFSKKLRQVRYLIIDEASNCLSSLETTDIIRVLRQYLSKEHQTVFLSSFCDEGLKRFAFRMLRTNFMFVNTLERFDSSHRFDFRSFLPSLESQNSGETQSSESRLRILHPNRVQLVQRQHNSTSQPHLSAYLIAGYLTDQTRKMWSPYVLRTVASLTNDETADELPIPQCSDVSVYTQENLREQPDSLTERQSQLDVTGQSLMSCTDAGRCLDIWVTRTTETALRSAVCPTSPHITITSYVYDPCVFIQSLVNLIYAELCGETRCSKMLFRMIDAEQLTSASHTGNAVAPKQKVLVLFTTNRAAAFYGTLFQRYLHPLSAASTRNVPALCCHGLQTAEERRIALQLFNRSPFGIMFATHVVVPILNNVSTVIQVGCLRSPADTVEATRVFSQP